MVKKFTCKAAGSGPLIKIFSFLQLFKHTTSCRTGYPMLVILPVDIACTALNFRCSSAACANGKVSTKHKMHPLRIAQNNNCIISCL